MGSCRTCLAFVLMIAISVPATAAEFGKETFCVAGRNFTIINTTPPLHLVCPDEKPNWAAFFDDGTVRVRGRFDAANIDVCSKAVNPYAFSEDERISYEIYDDWVIFRTNDTVPSAMRILRQGRKKIGINFSSQSYAVSRLTDVGPA